MSGTMAPPSSRRFVILREIGSGGSGRVYLAFDRYTGAGPIALKVFAVAAARGKAFRALEEEFLALRELSHPGLVRVYERGVLPETGEPFLTSEYIDGENLLAAAKDWSAEQLVNAAVHVLRALEYIHRRGWVHLDLKPGNILVTRSGEPKILDFGLAAREGRATAEGRIRGTLPYVAPETLESVPIDRRADLYSLGVVLFEALTGSLPERGENLLPAFSAGSFAGLPTPFDDLLPRLTDPDPSRRPPSAERAIDFLAQATGREIPVETEETLRANLSGGSLIGREVELGMLMGALREVVLDQTETVARRLVLVQGEAGIGKKRLLAEFRDRCQREGVDFFSLSCYEGEEVTWAPLEPVVRALVARVGEDSFRAKRARPALARILPDLAPDLTVIEKAEPGEEERIRWLEEVVRFLRAAAQGGAGYVLAVKDVHRAPFELTELLAYLVRALCLTGDARTPILLTLSARDADEMPGELRDLMTELSSEGLLLPIRLRRLTEAQVREYVASTLGLPDPPKRLISVLFAKSGGNPFLLEQLLRAFVEAGTIRYQAGKFRVSDLSRVQVPDTLQNLMARRFEDLSSEEREVLEVVAGYGEPIPVRILDEVMPGGAAVAEGLLERQILVEPDADGSVAFRHSLFAQYVLEHASPAHLREIHGRIGAVLSELGGERVFRPEKVAHHVSLGDDRGRALRFALDAARRFKERGQYDQVAIFTMRALARLEKNDPRRPDLLDRLGDAHVAAGRHDLAIAAYREMAESVEDPAAVATAHLKLAEVLERTGAWEEALLEIRAGLGGLSGAEPAARIPFLRLLGAVHKQRGEYEKAIEAIREGLRLARGEPSEETASLLSLLGNLYFERGDLRKALNFHLRSLRFAESIGFKTGVCSSLMNLGTLMSAWDDPDRALTYYSRALRYAEQRTNLPAISLLYNNIGNLYAERGDFERAEYYHRRSLAVRRRIGDPFGIAMSFGNIGSMHRLSGQWGLAIAYYERSIRHFDRIGNRYGATFFRSHLAELSLALGAYERAKGLLDRAEAAAVAQNLRRLLARVNLLFGRLFRLTADEEGARKRLTASIEIAREVSYREGVVEGQLELALAQHDRGRPGQALRVVAFAIESVGSARSGAAVARARLVRARLLTEERPGGGTEKAEEDLEAWLGFARESKRPDAIAEGLSVRAGRRLAEGDIAAAAKDATEALRLTESIADTLPEDLATIYRRNPARQELREIADAVRESLGRAGDGGPTVGLLAGSDRMKPESLVRLLEINKRLNSESDLHALLEFIMDTAVELTGAERGFLVLVDENRIAFQIARNFRRKEIEEPELKISQSIVRQVMRTGDTLLTDNATEDERFSKFRSVDDLKLTSIVCVPFKSRNRRLGALYLDNQARKGVFTSEDVDTLKALSDQAAIAIQNLQSKQKLAEKLQEQDTELERVRRALDERAFKYDYSEIIGSSPRMKEVFFLLDKIIDTEVPVLIQGESGTGKELVARAIHFKGPRKKGPFVPVNCGAVPDTLLESEFFGYVRGAFTGANSDRSGYFEQAHKGTLFLDEIGDMDFDMQKKLLRVLQQGEVRPVGGKKAVKVDVRIVCATNRDLRQLMLDQKFREDLYYRINVISVSLPSLRERREDIPRLVEHFVGRTAKEMGMAEKPVEQDAMALLTAYSWPGNVRELENEVKKAMALSEEEITADDLSSHIQGERAEQEPSLVSGKGTLKETMEATEKSIIVRALEETGGNQTRAAKNLGISRVWLRKKLEKYGLLD